MNDSGDTDSYFCDSIEYAKYEMLIAESQSELDDLHNQIWDAEALVSKVGLSARSGLTETVQQFRDGTASTHSTGGHSNIDHLIITTGHYKTDRITEWRRLLINRCRAEAPEHRGDDRWDRQKKAPGERRRRIVREKDLPSAPPEPPPSAYICFLGQMTTKMRHDRPNEPHRQPLIMRDISRLWTSALSEVDRQYYEDFCIQAREEYQSMHLEYRATGSYTPSERFERPDGANLWVHKRPEEKNELEMEIATYETVVFPMRPPEMDAEYAKREKEGRERRRLKLKLIAAEKRRLKNLPPIIPRLRKSAVLPEEAAADGTTTFERPKKKRKTNRQKAASDDNNEHNDESTNQKARENEDAAVSLLEEETNTNGDTAPEQQPDDQVAMADPDDMMDSDNNLEMFNEVVSPSNNAENDSNTEDEDVLMASSITEI